MLSRIEKYPNIMDIMRSGYILLLMNSKIPIIQTWIIGNILIINHYNSISSNLSVSLSISSPMYLSTILA